MAANYLRSLGIPCSLYIDDRNNGKLQVPLDSGSYSALERQNDRCSAAAQSAVFLVAYYLISLRYILGLAKSILSPRLVVPYLGLLLDTSREVFNLIPSKKERFLQLIQDIL